MDSIKLQVENDHAINLLHGVTSLLEEDFHTDFQIRVEGKCILAHKAVLAATSEYFRGMLSHNLKEVREGYVSMEDVTFESVNQGLRFMYTGKAEINSDNVQDIAHAAEILCLNGLSHLCSSYLQLHLSLENCLQTKAMADLYNWEELKALSRCFVIDNFESLVSSGLFTSLQIQDLKFCLERFGLGCARSWAIVIDWIKYSPKEREEELSGLMQKLGMEYFPVKFILETVLNEQLVMKSTTAKDMTLHLLFDDITKLQSDLSIDDCFRLRRMMKEVSSLDKKEANEVILKFLITHFDRVTENNGFLDLSLEEVKLLCGTPDTQDESEETRWHLITRWVNYRKERKKHFPDLFKLVNQRKMTLEFLESEVETEPLMQEFSQCQAAIPSVSSRWMDAEEGTEESEIHLAVLGQDLHYVYDIHLCQGILKETRLADVPFADINAESRIVCAQDQLVLIRHKHIFRLEHDKRWIKLGELRRPIECNTNVVFCKGSIFFIRKHEAFEFDVESKQQSNVQGCRLGQGFCSAVVEEKIFVMGGLRTSKEGKVLHCGVGETGISSQQCWRDISQMNHKRMNASAATVEKSIYVMGGIYAGQTLSSVEFYKEVTGVWTLVSQMLTCRSEFSAHSCGSKIFAVGGDYSVMSAKRSEQTIEVYDSNSGKWQIATLGLMLKPQCSICKTPLHLIGPTVHQASEKSASDAKYYTIKVRQAKLVKRIPGAKITFAANKFSSARTFKVSVDAQPADLPSVWEPVTSHFNCETNDEFERPAELDLLTGLPNSLRSWVTILQKSVEGEWIAVGKKRTEGNWVRLLISAPCELVGVVPTEEHNKPAAKDYTIRDKLKILKEPLPLDLCRTSLESGHMAAFANHSDFGQWPHGYERITLKKFTPAPKPRKEHSGLVFLQKGSEMVGRDSHCLEDDITDWRFEPLFLHEVFDCIPPYPMLRPTPVPRKKRFRPPLFWRRSEITLEGADSLRGHCPEEDATGPEVRGVPFAEKSLREEYDTVWSEFPPRVRKPEKISKTIGPKGGEIRLHSCSLEFSPGTVKEFKEMTVSVDNNPENFPPNQEAIALILGFKPSMKFDNPVLVTMRTWFRALEGETVPVILSSRKKGSEWRKVGDLTVGSTNEVKFTVTHFCQIGLGIAPQHADNGEYILSNDIYIQRETGRIHSTFYLDSRMEKDIWDNMRRKSCAAFSTKTLHVCGRRGQTVSVKANITAPPDTNLTEGYPSRQFRIQDIVKLQRHDVLFVPNPQFGNYDGLVEGEYFAELDREEADKTLLARKWPVTLDPPDDAPRINTDVYLDRPKIDTMVAESAARDGR